MMLADPLRKLVRARTKIRARSLVTTGFVLAALCISLGAFAQQTRRSGRNQPPAPAANKRPKLVLLIVVDQFRYDYLERFGDLFENRGLGRLMRDGALWTDANYDHMPTYTAPGHASMLTGAWPSQTGIVANEWYERETGKKVTSVTDDTTLLFAGRPDQKGSSPRRLLCSTVGDELRVADADRSKVIGISAKGRSAILPAGRHGSAAFWFGEDTGNMVSSNYYFDKMPDWVTRFNSRRIVDGWFGARWERLLPEGEYLKRAGKDDVPWENIDKASKDTNAFPHVINGGATSVGRAFYRATVYSPFSNDLLEAFAEEAITNEKLGQDDDTDLLSVSFSANDYVGHRFGPYSQEVMDMTLRVDRQIGKLLDFIDQRVGLQNTVVVFTADHGVAPVPEHAAQMNLPGKRYQRSELRKLVEDGLKAKYARPDRPATDYIQGFTNRNETEPGLINGNFYLNRDALRRDGISFEEAERVVGDEAMKMPGVARYFTRSQLENGAVSPSDPVARRVLHGFYSRRSGDVIVILEPYAILFDLPDDPTETRSTATHGSPYSYDTHVPLIMMGPGFAAGRYNQSATVADIASTLSSVLRIQAPSCAVGRVLSEAMTVPRQISSR